MLLAFLAAVIGIALLSKAADEFVEGAAAIAVALKISPVVVGAVIVGFGTSVPELLVSGISAVGGDTDVGVGNIIGSNIANLTLILGSAALLLPLGINTGVLRREAPLSTLSVLAFAGVLMGGSLIWWEGVLLLLGLAVSLIVILQAGRSESTERYEAEISEFVDDDASVSGAAIRTTLGLIGTVAGAWLLVWGAVTAADELGVSGGFIGITLVAVGTSLPELVTAVVAARKGEDDLIIGNLLGSNLFNSFAVGGTVAILGNGPIADATLATTENAFMVVVAVGALLAMVTRRRFSRIEGGLFLAAFVIFLVVTYVGEVTDDGETTAPVVPSVVVSEGT